MTHYMPCFMLSAGNLTVQEGLTPTSIHMHTLTERCGRDSEKMMSLDCLHQWAVYFSYGKDFVGGAYVNDREL